MTEAKTTPARKTGGRTAGRKSLTEKQKAEATAIWQAGEMTLDELAKRFQRTPRAMSMLFAKAGAKKGDKRAEVHAAVQQQVNQQIAGEASVIAGKIRETKDSHYALARVIAGLIQRELVQAQTQNKPFSGIMNEIKTLKLAAEALATLRTERYVLLGISEGEKEDPDDLPELPIHEMTAEQILDMQQRQDDSGLDVDDGDVMTVLTHDMGTADEAA